MRPTLLLTITLLLACATAACGAEPDERKGRADSVSVLQKISHHFTDIDTTYIEPQHYNWAVMGQGTWAVNYYTLRSDNGQRITFRPRSQFKAGPYFGYRWIFLGYTFDISHVSADNRKELDVSIYSNLMGVDIYYRKSGNQYYINRARFGTTDTKALRGAEFGGFDASMRGINVYYIFNHHHFSYPAAFSQSTVQRRSAGSATAGFSHTRHTLNINWTQLDDLIDERLGEGTSADAVDSTMRFGQIKYDAYALSGGYAYNWVFAPNWLLSAGLSMSLAYNQARSENDDRLFNFRFRNFSLHNFSLDGIFRFALVWNNTRWFAGLSSVVHSYNYNKSAFRVNNSFGTVSAYFGLNFGRMKAKKKHNKR